MLDPSKPYSYTGREAVQQLIGQVLGTILPGGEGLSAMITPWLLRQLGLSNDISMDIVMMSNMTPYGMSFMNQQRAARTAAQYAVRPISQHAQWQAYMAMAKTLNPELSDDAIVGKAQSYIANPMMNMLYRFMDPMGVEAANQYMSLAAGNMVRPALSRGDRTAYAKASGIISNMFRKDGVYNFDKRDWSHMNQGEVSAIMAAITKETDFLDGTDITDTRTLETATKRLTDITKKYAAALSPLKDIFGSDIPKMITTIEEISGQALTQLGPDRARALATQMVDRTQTGRYSVNDLAEWTSTYRQTLGQMKDLSYLDRSMAATYAYRALDAARGGIRPGLMSKPDYENLAANTILRTSVSKGADEMALTYSLWANNQTLKGNKDTSYSSFIEQFYDAGGTTPGQETAAMLKLAGVNTRYELEQGFAYDYYQQAKQDGMGGVWAGQLEYNRQKIRTSGVLSRSENVHRALFTDTEIKNIDRNTRSATIKNTFNKLLDAIGETPELAGLQGAAFVDALKQIKTATGEQMYTAADIKDMSALWNITATNPAYKQFYGMTVMQQNIQRQNRAAAVAATRREFVEAFHTGVVSENFKEFISKTLINGGKGFSMDNLKTVLGRGTSLNVAASPEALEDTLDILNAGAVFVNDKLKSDPSADKKTVTTRMQEQISELVLYANSAPGLANRQFQETLLKFRNAKEIDDKKAQAKAQSDAAAMLFVYRSYNPDAVDSYLGNEHKDQQGYNARREALLSTMQTKGVAGVSALVENTAIISRLKAFNAAGADRTDTYTEAFKGFRTAILRKIDGEKQDGIGESTAFNVEAWRKEQVAAIKSSTKDGSDARKDRMAALDDVIRILNRGQQGQVGTGALADVLSSLSSVLKELMEFLSGRKGEIRNS